MTPKVTYTLNGASHTITFNLDEFTTFVPGWEPDLVEFKHPFTGDKTRKKRGYYYTATIHFEAAPYDLLNGYRDLFNIATTDIKFYPNADDSEYYDVDTTEEVSGEDANAASAYKNVDIIFKSKKRYDSALEYTDLYWGARKTIFSGDVDLEAHRVALNAADDTDVDDLNAVAADIADHIGSVGHPDLYYTKAEVDALLDDPTPHYVYTFAGVSFGANPCLANEAGLPNGGNLGIPSIIVADGAITKISLYCKNSTDVSAIHSSNVNIPVTEGRLLEIAVGSVDAEVGYLHYVGLLLDRELVWSGEAVGSEDAYDTFSTSLSVLQ